MAGNNGSSQHQNRLHIWSSELRVYMPKPSSQMVAIFCSTSLPALATMGAAESQMPKGYIMQEFQVGQEVFAVLLSVLACA
jgi:hypothetical protein